MEDLASDRANLRNSPDRRIDFPAWKFTFWDLVFMLSQNTIINKHEVASLGLAAGSHHLISADYNFAWIGNNKCVFVDVHLEFNPLEHSLQTFFALHWVAIAPFFVIKIHKVSNRVKTAAYLERSSRYINQISCFEVLILRFGPQLVSIKLVILIHKVANRKIMNMEGGQDGPKTARQISGSRFSTAGGFPCGHRRRDISLGNLKHPNTDGEISQSYICQISPNSVSVPAGCLDTTYLMHHLCHFFFPSVNIRLLGIFGDNWQHIIRNAKSNTAWSCYAW